MDTVKRVFYAIAEDNLHTRREIAESLSLSVVSVGKAIKALISAGVLESCEKNHSESGRRSEIVEISRIARVLLIDLTQIDLAYSLSPLTEPFAHLRKLTYVDSLDFEGNLSLLISDARRHIANKPMKIAVALPGDVDGGRIANSYATDYSGFDVMDALSDSGLFPDIFVSGAAAVEGARDFAEGDVFISAGSTVWGAFGRDKVEHLGGVPVDNSGMLTYSDALRCSYADESVLKYSKRFLRAINGIISPIRILFSCELLSKEAKSELQSEIPNAVCVSAHETVLDGLMELVRDQILEEIARKQ